MGIVTAPSFNELRQVLDFAQTRLEELQTHEDPTNWEIECVSKMRDWLDALENLDELSKLKLALMSIPPASILVPEVVGLMTLSTGHVTEDVSDWLTDTAAKKPIVVYPKDDVGFWIWIADLEAEPDAWEGLPQSLQKVLEYAHEMKCEWLCLDRDGPVVAALETYEW